MNVLSLFNGYSAAYLAMERAGLKVSNYYSSEIDKYADIISHKNFKDIIDLGDVRDFAKWELPEIDILFAGSPCFVAGTKIITEEGYKNIEDIELKDKVLTHNNRFMEVTDLGGSVKEILEIKAQGTLPIKTTENHPFLVKKKQKKNEPGEWLKCKDINTGDFLAMNINQENKNKHNLTEEDCWLLGRYIADGHYRKDKRKNRKNSYTYQFIISVGKDKEEEFKRNIKNRNFSLYDHTQSVKRACFSSKELVELLEELNIGKGASNKKISKELLDLPKNLLSKVIDGYLSGDGWCSDKGKNTFGTVSEELALSMCQATLKVYGTPCMLTVYKPKETTVILSRTVKQKTIYEGWFYKDNSNINKRWFLEEDKVWVPVKKIERSEKELVFNMTVKEDNTYTANNIIVHNCQDLSRVKSKERTGLKGDKSSLFYSFYGALQLHKPKYFLLENVVMPKEDEDVITRLLGVEPVLIDSGKFSAQNRDRLYWTNIDFDKNLPDSKLVIKDIMESGVDEKYYYRDREFELHSPDKRVIGNLNTHTKEGKRHFTELTSRIYNINHKCATLTAVSGGHQEKKIYDGKGIRKLTPLEYERLQTLPDGYTEGVSNSQRYKMLGNGWTVDVIAHILKGIKEVE